MTVRAFAVSTSDFVAVLPDNRGVVANDSTGLLSVCEVFQFTVPHLINSIFPAHVTSTHSNILATTIFASLQVLVSFGVGSRVAELASLSPLLRYSRGIGIPGHSEG